MPSDGCRACPGFELLWTTSLFSVNPSMQSHAGYKRATTAPTTTTTTTWHMPGSQAFNHKCGRSSSPPRFPFSAILVISPAHKTDAKENNSPKQHRENTIGCGSTNSTKCRSNSIGQCHNNRTRGLPEEPTAATTTTITTATSMAAVPARNQRLELRADLFKQSPKYS